MKFYGPEHIWHCVPDVFGLREQRDVYEMQVKAAKAKGEEVPEEPVLPVFRIKVVSGVDLDRRLQEERAAMGKPDEAAVIAKIGTDILREKLDGIENLEVEVNGAPVEIKTFDQLRDLAPREFYAWLCMAVYSTQVLQDAEIKNY